MVWEGRVGCVGSGSFMFCPTCPFSSSTFSSALERCFSYLLASSLDILLALLIPLAPFNPSLPPFLTPQYPFNIPSSPFTPSLPLKLRNTHFYTDVFDFFFTVGEVALLKERGTGGKEGGWGMTRREGCGVGRQWGKGGISIFRTA